MKRVLKADLFELSRSKTVFILPGTAVLLGFLIPLMYYGITVMFDYLESFPGMDMESFKSASALMKMFNAKTVFLSVLPLSQGFGLVLTAMLGFRAVRPFGTGVYRNKIIAQVPRGSVYLSQSVCCFILAAVSASIYTLAAALASRLTFGEIGLTGREILFIALLSFGIYLVYTAISVFTAFATRNVAVTLIITILLPVLGQTLISILSPTIASMPDSVVKALSVLPSVQSLYMMSPQVPDSVLTISVIADVLETALLTVWGILRFRKTDLK